MKLSELTNLYTHWKIKNWEKIFDNIQTKAKLLNFYEKQKVTFTTKFHSASNKLYFTTFILKFKDFDLTDNDIKKVAVLFKHLKKLDDRLYSELLEIFNEKEKIIAEINRANNRAVFFEKIQSLDELLKIYEKHRLAFHHKEKEDNNIIENYYLPFINAFLKFKEQYLNSALEEKVYNCLLLLEHHIKKLQPQFELNFLYQQINYPKYVQLSILSRLPVKKRKDFFSYFSNQEELLKFYDKQKTTFYRKEKAKDIEYFRYFVLAIKKFEQDSPKIKTLTNYLKKIDPDYEKFLADYQITIPKSAQRPRRINKKTTPKTQKNKTNQNSLSQEKKLIHQKNSKKPNTHLPILLLQN